MVANQVSINKLLHCQQNYCAIKTGKYLVSIISHSEIHLRKQNKYGFQTSLIFIIHTLDQSQPAQYSH